MLKDRVQEFQFVPFTLHNIYSTVVLCFSKSVMCIIFG